MQRGGFHIQPHHCRFLGLRQDYPAGDGFRGYAVESVDCPQQGRNQQPFLVDVAGWSVKQFADTPSEPMRLVVSLTVKSIQLALNQIEIPSGCHLLRQLIHVEHFNPYLYVQIPALIEFYQPAGWRSENLRYP
jgi:hypothetical protein